MNQDHYDLKELCPDTPMSEAFLTYPIRVIRQYEEGLLMPPEAVAELIDWVLAADESTRATLRRELDAMIAYAERRKATPEEHARLKAELNRVSVAQRLIHHPRGLLK